MRDPIALKNLFFSSAPSIVAHVGTKLQEQILHSINVKYFSKLQVFCMGEDLRVVTNSVHRWFLNYVDQPTCCRRF